ncbi:MAG: type II toxin-antitoxin system VapC family toxin [Janthinobacterium lividum]
MIYSLLDTDTLTLYQNGLDPLVERVLSAFVAESLGVTVISVEEQLDGRHAFMRRAKTDAQLAYAYQNLTDSVRVLSGIHIVTFSEAAIIRYNTLMAMKLNVGKMDLRIAAIALEEGATVITRNLRDFQRVPGLVCENWAD